MTNKTKEYTVQVYVDGRMVMLVIYANSMSQALIKAEQQVEEKVELDKGIILKCSTKLL